jgi:oxidoreductase
MRLTRVAVVGAGWAARSIWMNRLHAHPGYTVTAVADPDPAARERVRSEGLAGCAVASVTELDPADLDLAVIAAPNHLHCALACSMLELGVPVFVEKPVCLSTAEARRLADAERSGGALLLAGSAARHRLDVRALYRLTGEVGSIRHVEASWVRARGIPSAGGWFTHREMSGGGALIDLGWHLLDAIRPLLGPVSFDQVAGTTSADFIAYGHTAAWRDAADGPAAGARDVEDTARGFLVTSDGASLGLRVGWSSHEPYDVTSIQVEGTRAVARLRCTFGFSPRRVAEPSLSLTRGGLTEAIPLPRVPIGAEYDRQLDAIHARLTDPDGARGQAITEASSVVGLIERFYKSARHCRVFDATTR